jgi:putative exosortase-associated protein (TIGR04073 family)
MNKLIIAFILITGFYAVAYGSEPVTVAGKTARGTKNIMSGWAEIPKRIVNVTYETKNPMWGVVAGVFQGTLEAVSKTASGVTEVVTAPADVGNK